MAAAAAHPSDTPKWIIKDSLYTKPEAGGPVKTWHKTSWDGRFRHAEKHRDTRGTPIYTVQAELKGSPDRKDSTSPVYVRRHTHTHSYKEGKGHTHTTTLRQTWRVGMPGGPTVHANYGAFCGELGHQVSAINKTLDSLKARCEKLKLNELQHLAEDECTTALRRACNQSVAHQIEFHQHCMEIWTGMTRLQQQQFVGAMSTAMQRWQEWTLDEQNTFINLFSAAADESFPPIAVSL